jgi:hypothetical protein
MITNPYRGAQFSLPDGRPITELKFGKSREMALSAATGEFNAYDKKELMHAIGHLMQVAASGGIVPDYKAVASGNLPVDRARELQERRELLAEAFNDPTGEKWAALGASLAENIREANARDGFLRRIAVGNTLKQGEFARIPMPTLNVVAVVATSSSNVGYQIVRTRTFQPAEFEINANIRVEQLEIDQVSSDILDESYNQGLESIMVAEDRLWKKAADAVVGIDNKLEYIAGPLTTQVMGNLRQTVARWNLPVTTMILANDYWTDIIGSSDFATFLDPVTKFDLALNGYLGTLIGMQLVTDAFRQPTQKVLNKGEIYVISAPENHAAYTDRGGVRSTPTSGANDGNTTKGWLLSEPFSLVLANPKSVARAKRIS